MDEGNMDMPVMEKRKKAVGAEAMKKGKKRSRTVGRATAARGRRTSSTRGAARKRDVEKRLPDKEILPVQIGDRTSEEEINLTIGICPYYKQERSLGRVSCEGAVFRFPDKLCRREYVYRFCAHPDGYKECPLKVALDHFYERKYQQDE